MHEKAVSFDWQDLVRRVQALAASVELPAPAPLTDWQPAAELVAELNTYRWLAVRWQAVPELAELQASPQACGPLVYALLTHLAQGHA
ncbi:hypothetical protein GCM10011495_39390 [Hymenobacter frigidus]|uniref:Uncharacterized protein n=1 Tax=Hymenobacter frigidus TaxID=1524095 RepID=A0ABQ2AGT6_9BACT|nr:hypothetical protein GCM10011495_39390 [Hymenobacter frigidus]